MVIRMGTTERRRAWWASVLLVILLVSGTLAAAGRTVIAHASGSLAAGDILVSGEVVNGNNVSFDIFAYDPAGNLLATLHYSNFAIPSGLCESLDGNTLYVPNDTGPAASGTVTAVSLIDGTITAAPWATTDFAPTACAVDANGNVLVSGDAAHVTKFSPSGQSIGTLSLLHPLGTGNFTDIALAGCTMYYGFQVDNHIYAMNACTGTQLGSITVPDCGGGCFPISVSSSGDLLVGAHGGIDVYGSGGSFLGTVSNSDLANRSAIPVQADPDGASMWAFGSAIYHYTLGGQLLGQFTPGVAAVGISLFVLGHSPTTGLIDAPIGAAELFGGGSPSEPNVDCGCQSGGDPVTALSGNYYERFTDLAIPGRGIPLDFSHTYNAQAAGTNGPLGYGWTGSYFASLSQDAQTGNVTFTEEGGSQIPFTKGTSGFSTLSRVDATLVKHQDGSFTVVRRRRETLTFNPAGQLTAERDPNGYTTALSYNTGGQLTAVTDPAGRRLNLSWIGGHVSAVADTIGRSVHFSYNSAGDLTAFTNVGGGVTRFTYDAHHRLLTMTDPRSVVTQNVYDGQSRVASQTIDPGGLNRTTIWQYSGDNTSATGGTTTITDPAGHVSVFSYKDGLRLSVTRGFGTPQTATWTYTYDPASGGVASVTDPNGHPTSSTYDADGNLLSATDPLGRTTTSTYNALDEPATVTDPAGVTTTNTYDAAGNLLSVSTPLDLIHTRTTTYTYGDPGHPSDVTASTDPDGKTWHYTYDANGYRNCVTDPLGNRATSTYDAAGRLLSSVSPRGNAPGAKPAQFTTTHTYNAFGAPLTTTDPLGHTSTWSYDADGNVVSVTDPLKHTTAYRYDAAGERITTIRADGTMLHAAYNPDGTLASQTNAPGRMTLYAYDALGRRTSATDPLGRTTTLTYDGVGNVLTRTDAQGNVTTYTYDAANERADITYSDGATPSVTGMTYDADGRRTHMTDGTGTTTWSYDAVGRLTRVIDGSGRSVSYAYDLSGLPVSVTYPNGQTESRRYDDAGRLSSVTDWLGHTTTFTDDPDGHLISIAYPAGSGETDTQTYDAAGRLTAIADRKGTATLAGYSYARTANGLVTTSVQTGGHGLPTINAYSLLDQLTLSSSARYAYDAAGNLTNMAGAALGYDAAGQLQSITGGGSAGTVFFDLRGNRTALSSPAGGITYSYDQANRLTGYTRGGTTASYTYDGDGMRVAKTVNGIPQCFVWDRSGVLPLLLADGSTSYLYGPGGEPIEQIDGQAHVLYLHHDNLGGIRLLTDAGGAVQGTMTFDAYGRMTAKTGAASTPFGFAGEYTDAESGLQYLRARYYDPSTGQFLTVDPLVTATQQPYAYAADDPANHADPSGADILIVPNSTGAALQTMAQILQSTGTGTPTGSGVGTGVTGGALGGQFGATSGGTPLGGGLGASFGGNSPTGGSLGASFGGGPGGSSLATLAAAISGPDIGSGLTGGLMSLSVPSTLGSGLTAGLSAGAPAVGGQLGGTVGGDAALGGSTGSAFGPAAGCSGSDPGSASGQAQIRLDQYLQDMLSKLQQKQQETNQTIIQEIQP